MDTYDILKELIGFDLSCKGYEEKIYSVSVKYPLSNYLRQNEAFALHFTVLLVLLSRF